MECSVCDTGDELLYLCERCGEWLCATHQGPQYHTCEVPSRPTWNTDDMGFIYNGPPTDDPPEVDRPLAQLFPVEESSTGEASGDAVEQEAPDTSRPGYGPDRLRASPVGPADSLAEWFRRQTYLSLTVKVGLIATLCNTLVFSMLALALTLSFG